MQIKESGFGPLRKSVAHPDSGVNVYVYWRAFARQFKDNEAVLDVEMVDAYGQVQKSRTTLFARKKDALLNPHYELALDNCHRLEKCYLRNGYERTNRFG
jgi:hypothetical protein